MIKNDETKSVRLFLFFVSLQFFIQCPYNSIIPGLSLPENYTGKKTIGHI